MRQREQARLSLINPHDHLATIVARAPVILSRVVRRVRASDGTVASVTIASLRSAHSYDIVYAPGPARPEGPGRLQFTIHCVLAVCANMKDRPSLTPSAFKSLSSSLRPKVELVPSTIRPMSSRPSVREVIASLTGLTYALSYLPPLISAPLLTGIADRFSRRTVMVITELVRAALVAVMAIPRLPLVVTAAALAVVVSLQPLYSACRNSILSAVLTGIGTLWESGSRAQLTAWSRYWDLPRKACWSD